MSSHPFVFLRACVKLTYFLRLFLEYQTCAKFSKCILPFLVQLDIQLPSFSSFQTCISSLKSPDSLSHLGFLHLLFDDSSHILSCFLPAVIFWESSLSSSLVSVSVDGEHFFRSLGENNNIQ